MADAAAEAGDRRCCPTLPLPLPLPLRALLAATAAQAASGGDPQAGATHRGRGMGQGDSAWLCAQGRSQPAGGGTPVGMPAPTEPSELPLGDWAVLVHVLLPLLLVLLVLLVLLPLPLPL